MSAIFIRVLTFYLICFSVFWLGVKIILRSQGFPFTLIWGFRDFDYLYQLVRTDTDRSRRAFFRGLLFCLYTLIALFPILPLVLYLFAP
jgi:hypothetical protein